MSLVYAAIVPNGTDLYDENPHFVDALHEIEGELYFMQPDILLVISSTDGDQSHEGVDINIAEKITAETVESPNTPSETRVFKTNIPLAMHCKRAIDEAGVDHTVISSYNTLPADTEHPLALLKAHLPNASVLDIRTSDFMGDYQSDSTVVIGQCIGKEIIQTNARVAVIVVGSFGAASGENNFYTYARKVVETGNMDAITQFPGDRAATLGATIFSPLSLFNQIQQSATSKMNAVLTKTHDERGYMVLGITTQ